MKLCGNNRSYQLGLNLNEPQVYPPQDSKINISSLLSFSVYYEHVVFIKKDGRAFAFGNNITSKIIGNIPKQIFKEEQEIILKDEKGHLIKFFSAVCGNNYTLYLVSNQNSDKKQLVYAHSNYSGSTPLFLNINGHNPVKLFGGDEAAAAIDAEGSIIIITESVIKSPSNIIEALSLPGGEKASSLACCKKSVIALSCSGRVFGCDLINGGKPSPFTEVADLAGKGIVQISGSREHFLAVSSSGKVFGRGSNNSGKLGIGKKGELITNFTEVNLPNKYRIVSASAGFGHSLFLTSEGKVLAGGYNGYGELLLNKSSDDVLSPIETTITSGATFCIAGGNMSAVFVGVQPPPNTPNTPVTQISEPTTSTTSGPSGTESSLRREIAQLKEKIEKLTKEKADQKAELESLRRQVSSSDRGADQPPVGLNLEILDSSTIHSLRTIREISFGGSGKVLEVAKEETFALKVMNTGDCSVEQQRKFIGEYEKLTLLKHPNIVIAYGIYLSDATTPPSILLEFCPQDLNQAIKNSKLNNVDIAKCIYQIAEGMKFVHARGFVHRDLKPSNILIAKNGLIRISDFGISKLLTSEEQNTTLGAGTQKFMAPEILKEEDYNEKVDVYSFGVVLFFILSGGKMPKISVVQVGNGKKADIPSDFTNYAKDLINRCWNYDPKDRPSFKQIIEDLEKNDYLVAQLNKSEIKDVKLFVKEHKKNIPAYSA